MFTCIFEKKRMKIWRVMTAASLFLVSPSVVEGSEPLFENHCTTLEVAKTPLSKNAVDVVLKQDEFLKITENQCFSDIWETRNIAERHLADFGYENRLCYSKVNSDMSATWQLVSYSSPPWYLDNSLFRKISSVWQQANVLFRTAFPSKPLSEVDAMKTRLFWKISDPQAGSEEKKTGTGALTNENVIQRQIIYPKSSDASNKILLLYNYAPLRTGGEQMHFLLVPNPKSPAKNFLELDREQYMEVLALSKKVALWAEKEFGHGITIHFFDKTGEVAGQTQPLYHAHLILVAEKKEEIWGRLSMFFRMIVPPSPLSESELERRVTHYRSSLGAFISHQD